MNSNKIILSALAMDLKRVALGRHNGSLATVRVFENEVMKRKAEIDQKQLSPYLRKIVEKIEIDISSEEALMFSTIIQNYVLHK